MQYIVQYHSDSDDISHMVDTILFADSNTISEQSILIF